MQENESQLEPILEEEQLEDTEMDDGAQNGQDVITFTFKRSHFYVALAPVAFLLGLGVGFFAWGRDGGQAAAAQGSIPEIEIPGTRYDIPINASDPFLGPEDAPITIIEFSDFECPFCRRHNLEVFPRLMAEYSGQIRYIFKDFPLTSIHPNAFSAAEAAHCAAEQDGFWEFHDLVFENAVFSQETYEQYASQIGINSSSFSRCLGENRYASEVQADYDFALQLGVRSTPTFFINGIAVVGAQPFEVFAQVIDSELSAAQ
jgi:protein-disulfide isomerase